MGSIVCLDAAFHGRTAMEHELAGLHLFLPVEIVNHRENTDGIGLLPGLQDNVHLAEKLTQAYECPVSRLNKPCAPFSFPPPVGRPAG